jgi:hypothetical protein
LTATGINSIKRKKYTLPYTFTATSEGQHNFCAYTDTIYLKKHLLPFLLAYLVMLATNYQIPFIIKKQLVAYVLLNFLPFVHQKPTQNKTFIGVTLPSSQCKYPNSKGYTNFTVHLVPN